MRYSPSFPGLFPTSGHVPTRSSPVRHCQVAPTVRLACVKHAASVRSEPGSNSQVHQAIRSMTCATSPDNPQKPIPNSTNHQLSVRPPFPPTTATLMTAVSQAQGHQTTTSLTDAQLERTLGQLAPFPFRGARCRLSRYRRTRRGDEDSGASPLLQVPASSSVAGF